MFPVPSCLKETTSFDQTFNYPAVFRAQQSVFQLPIFAYLYFCLLLLLYLHAKTFPVLRLRSFSYTILHHFFMCQLSIYYQLVSNRSPSLLYFVILELAHKHFSFASRQNVRFGQQRVPKGHSGNSSMKSLLVRVLGLFFFFLNFSTGSQWSSKTSSSCTLRPWSHNLTTVANLFAICILCAPVIAKPSQKRLEFSLRWGVGFHHKSLQFLHYPLFLNLKVMAAFLYLLLLDPLQQVGKLLKGQRVNVLRFVDHTISVAIQLRYYVMKRDTDEYINE